MRALTLEEPRPCANDHGVYGHYSREYRARLRSKWTRTGRLTLYYSYDTVVAFADEFGLHVCDNVWTVTTGKHLNWLDRDKKHRLPYPDFKCLLEAATERNRQWMDMVSSMRDDDRRALA